MEHLTVDQSIGPLTSAFLKIYTNHKWAVNICIYLSVIIYVEEHTADSYADVNTTSDIYFVCGLYWGG